MTFHPDFSSFASAYETGKPQVVWTTLVADLDTPVSAMLRLAGGESHAFLLESVEGGAKRGRYSFIGLKPDLIWKCHGNQASINRKARIDPSAFAPCPQEALQSLREMVKESTIDLPPELPPMAAGLFGYLGYDMIRLVERLPASAPDPISIPDSMFVRPTIVAVFDNVDDVVTIVTPVRPSDDMNARAAYNLACERLAETLSGFNRPLPHPPGQPADPETNRIASSLDQGAFETAVNKAKEYIRAGDIFQVVLSRRLSRPFRLPPFALYRALRRTNPSPFLFFMNLGDFALVGSSPEILVRVRDDKVTIRPIAGTRPRGQTHAEDAALAEELLADPKELAEHLMLLDLGRNDVGPVARMGTVQVTEQMIVEYYSHVMHIVSNVEGELAPNYDSMDALMSGFPAGTVSGAPKIRAMEIIDELEPVKRGFYAGAIGYIAANGELDTCITLRTSLIKDGMMHVQAGAGIVADSDPYREYLETENKARALFRAAEEAYRFAGI